MKPSIGLTGEIELHKGGAGSGRYPSGSGATQGQGSGKGSGPGSIHSGQMGSYYSAKNPPSAPQDHHYSHSRNYQGQAVHVYEHNTPKAANGEYYKYKINGGNASSQGYGNQQDAHAAAKNEIGKN